MWKKTAVTKFEVLSRNFLGRTEENHDNHRLALSRPRFDQSPPERKSEALPIEQTSSVAELVTRYSRVFIICKFHLL
jgi:hypothetical protein